MKSGHSRPASPIRCLAWPRAAVWSVLACFGVLALAGCSGMTADLHANGWQQKPQGELSYRVVRSATQRDDADQQQYETLVREGLAKFGFVEGSEAPRYLVSIAWASRPADVTVTDGACAAAPDECRTQASLDLPWSGRPWVHALTLRWLALPGGQEVYRVSVVKRDHDADERKAMPSLVQSALARFPYAGSPDWRVKLRVTDSGAAQVVSVVPVQR